MLRKLWSTLRAPVTVAIPDALWTGTIASLACLRILSVAQQSRLRTLCGEFLACKQMSGAAELELTAAMQVSIAAQACLPVLELGLHWYRGWSGIVVYPDEFLVTRRMMDDSGVVHEGVDERVGEAWHGGPVVLSWHDADPMQQETGQDTTGFNVVIHEFAHQLDLLNGVADGMPPFDRTCHATLDPVLWSRTLADALQRMDSELALIASELPAGTDPDDPRAVPFYAHLPLDPYATEDQGEFFAVSSEAFFTTPHRLRDAFPQWYEMLRTFFRQDPLMPQI